MTKHLECARQILADNPMFHEKLRQATGLPSDAIEPLSIELVRYLELLGSIGERLTPSHTIDLAWHELILFTRYYAAYCTDRFGRYIHHQPGDDEEENRRCFKRTHYWYRRRFGEEPDPRFWGKVIAEVADSSDCGLCSSD
jgi:hypothetical protein